MVPALGSPDGGNSSVVSFPDSFLLVSQNTIRSHTCMMGVLWQIFWEVFYRPSARFASPPGDKKPPKKFATKRPIIHVCKAETSY